VLKFTKEDFVNYGMKKISAIVLIALALVMFYLAYQIGGLPPAITGVGFLLIAFVFLRDEKPQE
jgi:succinate dehydrogenase hydrophobic anchor subunit